MARQDDQAGASAIVCVQNWALEFDGKTTGVHIPTLDYDGSHPITIEAIVNTHSIPLAKSVTSCRKDSLAASSIYPDTLRHVWRMGVTMIEPDAYYFGTMVDDPLQGRVVQRFTWLACR